MRKAWRYLAMAVFLLLIGLILQGALALHNFSKGLGENIDEILKGTLENLTAVVEFVSITESLVPELDPDSFEAQQVVTSAIRASQDPRFNHEVVGNYLIVRIDPEQIPPDSHLLFLWDDERNTSVLLSRVEVRGVIMAVAHTSLLDKAVYQVCHYSAGDEKIIPLGITIKI